MKNKFGYSIKEKKKNDYGIYDIKGESNIIRVIEFSRFSSEKNDKRKYRKICKKC